jgi:hypothetical protein
MTLPDEPAEEPGEPAAASRPRESVSRLGNATWLKGDLLGELAGSSAERVKLAQQILHRRMLRARFLNPAMLDHGPWDMLLTVYVAQCTGQQVGREDLSNIGGLPGSVSARWIKYLEQSEMIRPGVSGAAIVFDSIRLWPKAEDALNRYLSAVLTAQTPGE